MNFIHPELEEWLRPLLKDINSEVVWITLEAGMSFETGDLIISPTGQEGGEGVHVLILPHAPAANFGPPLAELIERLSPQLVAPTDEVLELTVEMLADGWDSAQDLDRLKRLSLELWRRQQKEYDRRWLHLAKLAHLFGFKQIQPLSADESVGPVPLYVAMGYLSWSAFAKDLLGIFPAQASQLKWVWEIYHEQLGWSAEKMLLIGKAKLGLAVGTLRRELARSSPIEENIKALLDHVADPKVTFAILLDKLQAGNANGMPVQFAREATYQPDVVHGWLGDKEAPPPLVAEIQRWLNLAVPPQVWLTQESPADMVHLSVFLDRAFWENAVALVFDPNLAPEAVRAIKETLAKRLHWERAGGPEQRVQEVEDDANEEL